MIVLAIVIMYAAGTVATSVALAVQLNIMASRNPTRTVDTTPARMVWLSLTWLPRVVWVGVKAFFRGV